MSRVTGESSFNTFQRDTDMVTTTTPRPPVLKPVCSPILLADSWLLATSQSALKSMSITECCLLTHVTPTEDSSSTPTSFQVPVHAISQHKSFPIIPALILDPKPHPLPHQCQNFPKNN